MPDGFKSCPVSEQRQQKADGSRLKNTVRAATKKTQLSNSCSFLSSTFDLRIFSQTAQSTIFRGKKRKLKRRTNMQRCLLFMCLLGAKAVGYSSKLHSLLQGFVSLLLSDVAFMSFFFFCFVSASVCIICALIGRYRAHSDGDMKKKDLSWVEKKSVIRQLRWWIFFFFFDILPIIQLLCVVHHILYLSLFQQVQYVFMQVCVCVCICLGVSTCQHGGGAAAV